MSQKSSESMPIPQCPINIDEIYNKAEFMYASKGEYIEAQKILGDDTDFATNYRINIRNPTQNKNTKGTFWLEVEPLAITSDSRYRFLKPNDLVIIEWQKHFENGETENRWKYHILYIVKDRDDLKEIIMNGKTINNKFYGIKNGIPITLDSLVTTYVTNMDSIFENFVGDLENQLNYWDTRYVTSMKNMFKNAKTLLNGTVWGIGIWDVSSVKDMSGMFENCINFNDRIDDWDVSNVLLMVRMFQNAIHFNQDISYWNVENVENTSYMFKNAKSFKANIMNWDLDTFFCGDNIGSMSHMFAGSVPINYKSAFKKKWYDNCNEVGDIFGKMN